MALTCLMRRSIYIGRCWSAMEESRDHREDQKTCRASACRRNRGYCCGDLHQRFGRGRRMGRGRRDQQWCRSWPWPRLLCARHRSWLGREPLLLPVRLSLPATPGLLRATSAGILLPAGTELLGSLLQAILRLLIPGRISAGSAKGAASQSKTSDNPSRLLSCMRSCELRTEKNIAAIEERHASFVISLRRAF